MNAHARRRHTPHRARVLRGLYLPRASDALALAMSTYGLPLLVLATTRSSALTGTAFALEWVPRLAAFWWAGPTIDRRGAPRVFVLASLGRALVLAAGAALLLLHSSGAAGAGTVMSLAAATGVLAEFSYVAAETTGAAEARRAGQRAHRVQAALLGIDQTATLAGPALAGLLLLAGPPQMLAAIMALSLLASLLLPRTPSSLPDPAPVPHEPGTIGLPAGWQTIRSLPALGWLITGLALSNMASGFLQAAGPVIVEVHYGQSTTAVGLVWSAAAAATILSVALCRFAIDRLGLWPVGAACAALASLACLAAARAPGYLSFLILVAALMAAEGGMTVVLRTLRSRLIPPEQFGSALAATILILLLPFPVAGLLTALTPPDAMGHVVTACAVLQALGLFLAFARLRTEPALRT